MPFVSGMNDLLSYRMRNESHFNSVFMLTLINFGSHSLIGLGGFSFFSLSQAAKSH